MAFYDEYVFFLDEPQIIPETLPPPPLFVQIELTLTLGCTYICHDYRTGRFIEIMDDSSLSEETLCFDLDILQNHNQVHQIIAPALTSLGLDISSSISVDLVHEIINLGLPFGNCLLDGEVLSLCAGIWRTSGVLIKYDRNSLSRDLSESSAEFEASNYVMIPAKESSVKEILMKVSMEVEEKDCMICMEKLEVGSDASWMPWFHTFHDDCIEKWLKQSHTCPICRYKTPSKRELGALVFLFLLL